MTFVMVSFVGVLMLGVQSKMGLKSVTD